MIEVFKNKLKKAKGFLEANKLNSKGTKLNQKILIIESDDWGAIRTPSPESIERFNSKEFRNSIYKNDSLANEEDLDALFNLLNEYEEKTGKNIRLTANVCVANPDFEKIKESGYNEYHYEHFTSTLKRYPQHSGAIEKWKSAIENGIFKPQFHCREHLNINRWMTALQRKEKDVLSAFELNMTYSGKGDYSFMEAYDWDVKSETADHIRIIEDGLKIFEDIFGYRSISFIAPCYNWDPELELPLAGLGIKIIQGLKSQLCPTGNFDVYSKKEHTFGERNLAGQIYNIRNCFLEPSMNPKKDWVDSCLAQIHNAFLWNKPAVICSHRVNYVGYIDKKNRDRGLNDLKSLLGRVIKKWPDVEVFSTDQLHPILN